MRAADAFGIALNKNTPDMSGGSFKKLRDLEGAASGDFSAVITAKISTSIQDLKNAGNMRTSDVPSNSRDASSSVKEVSVSPASKHEKASFGRASSRIREASPEKKGEISSSDGKVKDALEKFETEVKEELKKVLGVSDEDIENAMEELSLSYVDLSDVSKLSMLFMKLSGVSEQSELLLTDGFLELKNSVAELSSSLFKETGLDAASLNIVQSAVLPNDSDPTVPYNEKETVQAADEAQPVQITQDAAMLPEEASAAENATVAKDMPQETVPAAEDMTEENASLPDIQKGGDAPVNERPLDKTVDETPAKEKGEGVPVVPVKEASDEGASADGAKAFAEVSEKVPSEAKGMKGRFEKAPIEGRENEAGLKPLSSGPIKSASPDQSQNPLAGQGERGNEQAMHSSIFSSSNFSAEAPVQASEVPVTPYSQQGLNPSDIVRQLVSGVRTVVTEALKTMEVQLNPENLGKMIIHVSEQNGQLTARINIQNENVRTAMEEQMAIVKNNLEAQGLKVESVTVTADPHEFERNLEEGNSPKNDMNSPEGRQAEADPAEGDGGRRRGVRNLNMNELEDGAITDLTEDELLAARIMRENGSTLNINA